MTKLEKKQAIINCKVMTYEYTDGTRITLSEIIQGNTDGEIDIDALKRLKIGETYVINMGEYLIRIS